MGKYEVNYFSNINSEIYPLNMKLNKEDCTLTFWSNMNTPNRRVIGNRTILNASLTTNQATANSATATSAAPKRANRTVISTIGGPPTSDYDAPGVRVSERLVSSRGPS